MRNRQEIRSGRCSEWQRYSAKTILNRGLWGFYDEMPGYDYNLERAKQLMKESGVTGPIKTTLTYATGAPYEQIATVIQANLAQSVLP